MKTLDLRTILGAILIFGVIAGGFSLWYHHEMRKLDAEDKHFGDTPDVFPTTDTGIPEDTVADETRAVSEIPLQTIEDMPVSPHGFGPYPELPEGWGPETWNNLSANHELMKRVRIKLISQGINAVGTTMENGLVYPTIKGIVYVKWKSYLRPTGIVRYISRSIGHPDDNARLDAIIFEKGRSFTEADVPSDIELVPYEGIDPYQFLDLPRN